VSFLALDGALVALLAGSHGELASGVKDMLRVGEDGR